MKELSIEEKAKRYDEVVAMAKECITHIPDEAVNKYMLDMFPELKESEDERIRKAIIEHFAGSHSSMFPYKGFTKEQILAWLEKQGEQKLYVNDNAKEMFIKALERVEEQNSKGYKLTDCDKNSWWEDFKTYTSEQNLANSAKTCKVKPKSKAVFHKGDWVVCEFTGSVYQIKDCVENLSNHKYGCDLTDGSYIGSDEVNHYHLWTIKDAKDGDILFHSDTASNGIFIFKKIRDDGKVLCYCDYDSEDHFCTGEHHTCCWVTDKCIKPATKEQRELLFQKMKEAGYVWNKDKKKLIKL